MQERNEEKDINISHQRCPSYAEHVAFYRSRPYYRWYLTYHEKDCLGSLNVTWRNEIGIVLFPEHRGNGWGRKVLETLLSSTTPLPAVPSERQGHFIANINPNNKRSIHLFETLGFKHVQNTYILPR